VSPSGSGQSLREKYRIDKAMEGRARYILRRIELVLLLTTAGVSLAISVLDLIGLLDTSSWIAQRIPALVLLCLGFVASYLIVERRGKLEDIARIVDERSIAILQAVGVEVEEYQTSADWVSAIAMRVRSGKHFKDVSWAEEEELQHRWSQEDRVAYEHCNAIISEVIRKQDVIWREVCVFSRSRFARMREDILDESAIGYSVAYFEPSTKAVPRIGGFLVIDDKEVFVASAESTIWLRVKHPAIVRYFSEYFETLWRHAKVLKKGPHLDRQRFERLDARFRS